MSRNGADVPRSSKRKRPSKLVIALAVVGALVLGGTVVVGVCFIALNALSDLLYKLLDPRSR